MRAKTASGRALMVRERSMRNAPEREATYARKGPMEVANPRR
jgi:hypothetical protein